jgi:hypothetical protein
MDNFWSGFAKKASDIRGLEELAQEEPYTKRDALLAAAVLGAPSGALAGAWGNAWGGGQSMAKAIGKGALFGAASVGIPYLIGAKLFNKRVEQAKELMSMSPEERAKTIEENPWMARFVAW